MRTVKHPHDRENLAYYLQGLIDNKYTLNQVSRITGYTKSHLCVLKGKFKKKGENVLINGHKGMKPKNTVPDDVKKKIIDTYRTDFDGVNFHFFRKALNDYYDIHYSYRTIYTVLTEAGIESPEKHNKPKKYKVHRPRYRRDSAGDLIQIDATPYQWFLWCGDTSYYTLHGAIDDAEEKLTGLCMTENECSYGYYDILEQTIDRHGLMFDIYSDRSAIFCVNPKDKDKLTIQEQLAGVHEKRTQWQQILDKLRIKQILAWSPQAKGRVERMWRTLQGRLPWYFKHYKIKTIQAANDFLKTKYIDIFNNEFGIVAKKAAVWRKPPANYKDFICSKFERTTDNSGVISFQGYKFSISAPDIAKRKIELCIYKDGMKALIDGVFYPVTLRDNLQDGIGETMSTSLKNIIYEYMLTDCKKICA